MYGIYSGKYSQKKTKPLPDNGSGKIEIEEYQDGIKPSSFKTFFNKGHKDFSSNRQQDAAEYLTFILEKFERQEKLASRPNPKSPFEFELESRIECLGCHIVKYNRTKNCYLPMPILDHEQYKEPGKKLAIDQLINWFTVEEIVGLNCLNCGNDVKWKKSQRVVSFPPYLIIAFGRFIYDWVPKKLDVELTLTSENKIDFTPLNREHSKQNEKVLTESKEEEFVEPEFNQQALNQLKLEGLPELAAKHALLNSGNTDANEALNWYFMNMESFDLSKPIQKVPKTKNVNDKIKANPELVQQFLEMGYQKNRAEFALEKCDNNFERAMDYLFNHFEDSDFISGSSNVCNQLIIKLDRLKLIHLR